MITASLLCEVLLTWSCLDSLGSVAGIRIASFIIVVDLMVNFRQILVARNSYVKVREKSY